jgi:large subunit ribosomal protein L10
MSESESVRQTEQIPAWKQAEVDELTTFVEAFPSVGIVEVSGIPSRQLQSMRAELHGRATVRMSRNSLVERALEAGGGDAELLIEHLHGQVALIGTEDNPFGLYRQLEASKTPAPIGPGEIVPNDIVIPAGDTGVDPGPFVGELQQVGAAARIMEGSIRVTEDSQVASAGDTVSEELAGVLNELGMEPKEVGLDLRAVVSDGVLFAPDELAIDIDEYRSDLQTAAARAMALSVGAAIATPATAAQLLAAAEADARAVGRAAAVEAPELIEELLALADGSSRALAVRIDDPAVVPEDITAPAAPAPAVEEPVPEEEEEAQPADDEDDDDDDEDSGAEGLGAMFG